MSTLAYNGGSIVAMCGKNCVGIAKDYRIGVQPHNVEVFEVGRQLFMGLAGLKPDIKALYARLMFRQDFYEFCEGRAMLPILFSGMVSDCLYSHGLAPYFVEPVIAGLNPYTFEPFICSMNRIGCRIEADDFVVASTRTTQLYGMCRSIWQPDMDAESLAESLCEVLRPTSYSDAISGSRATIHIIEKNKDSIPNGFHHAQSNGNAKTNSNYELPLSSQSKTACNEKKLSPSEEHQRKTSFEEVPLHTACLTYLGFYLLMILGYINQLLFVPKVAKEENRDGYVTLYDAFESFYSRYVYRRVRDCWNRPICSCPGAEVTLKDRITKDYGWSFEFTGTETRCLNLGSYNYLGFADSTGPCTDNAEQTAREMGLALASPRVELGTTQLHLDLEKLTARYLRVEDAIVFGMGFATNALNLPSLLSPGCLVLSDEKNHASIILGLRLSGATTKVFKHNNMRDLERVLRNAVVYGNTKDGGKPWKKILIIVEGVFSMEGSIVRLPEIVALKKKYKAYLYLDEAHSIGAMGPNGGGALDYFGVDPKDVDILMGTFTKSFGSAGGYIAGSKKLIGFLRTNSHAHCYASTMSPPVAQQIYTSMRIIMGLDNTDVGRQKINQLARNTRYFRRRLQQMGVITYGHEDSPVVPMLVYLFSKIGAVVRTLTTRHIAVVGVGFPATPIMEGRIRYCLSAAHTKEQLDYALDVIDEISDNLGLKYSRKPRDPNPIEY